MDERHWGSCRLCMCVLRAAGGGWHVTDTQGEHTQRSSRHQERSTLVGTSGGAHTRVTAHHQRRAEQARHCGHNVTPLSRCFSDAREKSLRLAWLPHRTQEGTPTTTRTYSCASPASNVTIFPNCTQSLAKAAQKAGPTLGALAPSSPYPPHQQQRRRHSKNAYAKTNNETTAAKL